MDANNVVVGPWGSAFFDEYPTEDSLLNTLVEDLTDALFEGFREAGFDNLGEMVYTKDLALINESIRSYLMKLQDRYHPCQDVSDDMFEFDEDGYTLIISDSLDIVFQPDIEIDLEC